MSQFASYFLSKEKQDSTTPAPNSTTSSDRSPYRILFVDDEPNVLRSLKRVFHKENYEIHLAKSGEEGLELIQQHFFHLMVTDYKMPGMNGAELLRKVKEVSPETLRIMLTGHADTQAVMAAINEGAVYRFILKPWNDDDLRVTVALALEQFDLKQKNRELEKTNSQQQKDLKLFSKMSQQHRSQLAVMLHKHNLLNRQQVQELYKLQQSRKTPVIKLLMEKQWISEKKLYKLLKDELLFEEVSLDEFQIEPGVLNLIPADVCTKQYVLPLKVTNRRLLLAMADPLNQGLTEELGFALGLQIDPVLAHISDLETKLSDMFGSGGQPLEELETLVDTADPAESIELVIEDDQADQSLEELLAESDQPPAIRMVNAIIMEALRLGASDIHIHPRTNVVVVRYRIDGVLQDKIRIPHALHATMVSRIKVMSELDITERRRPQDGRITVKTPMRIVDLRLSTLPTINGEKVVMRVLDRNNSVKNIDALDLSEFNRERILNAITRPQGMILATGPTGSGKTTTLYALLQQTATPEKNYVTIEDPVEFYMDMAGQVPVRERVGLSFASILRAILRQDPDVILLGEIRDHETAEVALHAAMTGHMVYSTLHTNSSVGTLARLLDLGIKPYVAAQALECIIAQRLVRQLCPDCREPVAPDPKVTRYLGPHFTQPSMKDFHAPGCPSCHHQGFKGRVGLYEVLPISDSMRHLIASGASIREMEEQAQAEGMVTLVGDAFSKVQQGRTSAAEILRVLGSQITV